VPSLRFGFTEPFPACLVISAKTFRDVPICDPALTSRKYAEAHSRSVMDLCLTCRETGFLVSVRVRFARRLHFDAYTTTQQQLSKGFQTVDGIKVSCVLTLPCG